MKFPIVDLTHRDEDPELAETRAELDRVRAELRQLTHGQMYVESAKVLALLDGQ